MNEEQAECGDLAELMHQLGGYLDHYLRFEHGDALPDKNSWQRALGGTLPHHGIGIEALMTDIGQHLIPNGSQIPKPGCSSFITTGATSVGALATIAGAVASPQRFGLTAFNYLEQLSLSWMAELFDLSQSMTGIYSSGGSVANLVALGAARQRAFEAIGIDPSLDGNQKRCRIYSSEAGHKTIARAAAVLGMGRNAVVEIACDQQGRMLPGALLRRIEADKTEDFLVVAIVATAGTTSTGAIDPLQALGHIAQQQGIWFHIDGAYGLPGILDPKRRERYQGLQLADSVIVDPHKWLGAPVGIGATYVRDIELLKRAFKQGESDYFEGSFAEDEVVNSMDHPGIPYTDLGVELSSPSRGAVVWALIREIGVAGLTARICRHNAMASYIAERARAHPRLELLLEPELSICCFRYLPETHTKLDDEQINSLNKAIHRQLLRNAQNLPSTAIVGGKLAIRPCFIGARTHQQHAVALVEEVITLGDQLARTTNINGDH